MRGEQSCSTLTAMKPKFFVDTHVGNVALQQLRRRGIDIIRCEEVGLADAKDYELLAYATQQDRVMVSCDEDFEILHYQYLGSGQAHAGIIYMDQEQHCKHVGEIVKIIVYYHALAESASDLANELWRGTDAK